MSPRHPRPRDMVDVLPSQARVVAWALAQLADRMEKAHKELRDMSHDMKRNKFDRVRLAAKASGVALARSYVLDHISLYEVVGDALDPGEEAE